MLVEDIEPGPVPRNPFQTRDFDIDLSAAPVGVTQLRQKTHGVGYMLQHMPQDQPVCAQPGCRSEIFFDDRRVVAFVGRVQTGDLESQALQHLQEIALAATHLDQGLTTEMSENELRDLLQVGSERRAVALFILVVGVVAHQLRVEGLVEYQAGRLALHQHHVAAHTLPGRAL